MERYDYLTAVKNDVLAYLRDEAAHLETYDSLEELEERINDELWIADNVTGNASGSYFCNAYRAEEALAHNCELLAETLEAFGDSGSALERGPEYCDVCVRCYVLPEAIREALEELKDELEETTA